mgnify:CR=1 FL=1|jgi:hypothetical protein
MKNYIGVKEIKARPMNRLDYNVYRGWELPSDENGEDEGYLVEYTNGSDKNHQNHDGYVSWSPKDPFEEAYRETIGLPLGLAIEALKKGRRIARKGWNGKGMFIFMQVPSTIGMDIVPKMQSLPDSVKDEFIRRQKNAPKYSREDMDIRYRNQIAMVYPDNTIYGWVASPSDLLEEDWVILED